VSRTTEQQPAASAGDDAEVIDAVPVDEGEPQHVRPAAPRASAGPEELATAPSRPPARGSAPVAARAAAVAVTFAAGAVTAAVVRGASKRRAVKAAKRSSTAGLSVLSTRSFMVDVHLLGPRD
jgi:hypothetical protein